MFIAVIVLIFLCMCGAAAIVLHTKRESLMGTPIMGELKKKDEDMQMYDANDILRGTKNRNFDDLPEGLSDIDEGSLHNHSSYNHKNIGAK